MTELEIDQLQVGDDLFVSKLNLMGSINRTIMPQKIKLATLTEISESSSFNVRCVFLGIRNSTTIEVKIWDENIKTPLTLGVHIECVS